MLFESEIKRIYDSRHEYEWEFLERHRTGFRCYVAGVNGISTLSPSKNLGSFDRSIADVLRSLAPNE